MGNLKQTELQRLKTEERKTEDKMREPQETAPGHSQKIEASWWQWVGEKPKTGESGH